MPDLLVIGDCNPDLLLCGGDVIPAFGQREKLIGSARLVIGGSAAITACGAARLGLETALVAVVGDDLFGHFMLDSLAERGVDATRCVVDAELSTGLTVVMVRGRDRASLTAPGAIPALSAAMVDRPLLRSSRHLHLGSYFLQRRLRGELPELMAEARAAGATVSVDTQEDAEGGWDGGLLSLLPLIDLLFVNELEDAHIASASCPLVIVKRGERGATARTGTGELHAAAIDLDVVDATGAGDSFDAGFLASWIADGDVARALRLACACGSLATRALGGTAAQPTMAEAVAAL